MTKDIYYKIEVQDWGRWVPFGDSEYQDEQEWRSGIAAAREKYPDCPFRPIKYILITEEVKE